MALLPENKANMAKTEDEDESKESGASLHLLSNSELELMQNITLNQMKGEPEHSRLFLLSRVWYRLEQERRRRRDEVRELERLYFARGEKPGRRKASVQMIKEPV
jgi:hypothetical protein